MSASYGIDKEHLLVWLDSSPALDPALAGSLCRRHADALIVPKGWRIDDRREAIPRLFHAPDTAAVGKSAQGESVELAVIEQTPGGGVRRRVHKSVREEATQASLFDDGVSGSAHDVEEAAGHNEVEHADDRVVEDVDVVVDDSEETRAIPWMPRLVSRAPHTESATDADSGTSTDGGPGGVDATPAQGRLLRRAFGDRNVR